MTCGDGADAPSIPTIWNVTPAHGSIYAGVEGDTVHVIPAISGGA